MTPMPLLPTIRRAGHIVFELGLTEIVNLAGELVPENNHATVFGTEMGMLIGAAEKGFGAVAFRDDAKETAHIQPPMPFQRSASADHLIQVSIEIVLRDQSA